MAPVTFSGAVPLRYSAGWAKMSLKSPWESKSAVNIATDTEMEISQVHHSIVKTRD